MHPEHFKAVLGKAQQAAHAADAAKKARELVRRKNVLTRSTLPGKLADCTSASGWGGAGTAAPSVTVGWVRGTCTLCQCGVGQGHLHCLSVWGGAGASSVCVLAQ